MHFRRSALAVATLFFILGFNYGTWTARIPALATRLDLDTGEVGLLLLASGLGAVAAFPVTATLLRVCGPKRACWISAMLLPGMIALLGFAPNFYVAALIMAFEGVLTASLNVAMNTAGVLVEQEGGGRPIMSRLHAVFSLGAFVAAVVAATFVAHSSDLAAHFLSASVLLWALGILACKALPELILAESPSRDGRRFALPAGAALLLAGAAFSGTIVEGAMLDWSALYLKTQQASEQIAALGVGAFSMAMFIARLMGDGWRARFGARAMVVYGCILAGAGLGAALLAGGAWVGLAGLVAVGIGVAAVSPCIYLAASKEGAVALAGVTTLGSVGSLLGPPVIGFVAHAASLPLALGLVVLAAFAVAAIASRVRF
ncbi:MFS transporter [Chitinibacteraceae bacterium HSL-7]